MEETRSEIDLIWDRSGISVTEEDFLVVAKFAFHKMPPEQVPRCVTKLLECAYEFRQPTH